MPNVVVAIVNAVFLMTLLVWNMIENDFWIEKDRSDERDDVDS